VHYDDVQYDKHGWRNRNRIKTADGSKWLTIPCSTKGVTAEHIPINRVEVTNTERWQEKHWRTLEGSYRRAPFFEQLAPTISAFWQTKVERLVDLTIPLTEHLAGMLGVEHVKFVRSSSLSGIEGVKTERIISVCQQVGATSYLSGPSAKDYIDESQFARAGIALEWMSYEYAPYPQLHGEYDPQLSILDLLFMTGPEAPGWIWPGVAR
jgi:hypothetical protein